VSPVVEPVPPVEPVVSVPVVPPLPPDWLPVVAAMVTATGLVA